MREAKAHPRETQAEGGKFRSQKFGSWMSTCWEEVPLEPPCKAELPPPHSFQSSSDI